MKRLKRIWNQLSNIYYFWTIKRKFNFIGRAGDVRELQKLGKIICEFALENDNKKLIAYGEYLQDSAEIIVLSKEYMT